MSDLLTAPDTDALPMFDTTRPCRKCINETATVRFECLLFRGKLYEWLLRTCERCGFQWSERCEDAKEAAE
jgi:hypothetical protein